MGSENKHGSDTEPRERILAASIELFSRKGFSATGVREIASKAGVNIAMINYYFGSKQGLLKELIQEFFTEYREIAVRAMGEGDSLEEKLQRFIRHVLAFFLANPERVRIFFIELPQEMPELVEFKGELIRQLIGGIRQRLAGVFPFEQIDPQVLMSLFPSIIAILSSHCLLKPIIQSVGLASLDETFYRKYPEVITDLVLGGMGRVLERIRKNDYRNLGMEGKNHE